MKNARRLPLAVGLLLALGTSVMLLNYMGSMRGTSAAAAATPVFVASRDIPARALLTNAYISEARRRANEVDHDAAQSRKEIVGKYALISIPAGSVLTKSKIGPGGANALPARLPLGMRAVSISIDRVKGVAGLIQPGDRVDVIAVPPRVSSEVPHAAAILRGALVLAVGNEVETTSATPSPDNQNVTTVTLALTPPQVDLLASADLNTTLRLALRPPKESIRSFPPEPLILGMPQRPTTVQSTTASTPLSATAIAAAAPAHVRVAVARRGVIVIDGDRIVDGESSHP